MTRLFGYFRDPQILGYFSYSLHNKKDRPVDTERSLFYLIILFMFS